MTQQPSSRSRRMCAGQPLDLLGPAARRSARRGSSTRGSGGEHPDQLDDLPLGDREVGRDGAAVDVVDAVAPQDRRRRRRQPAPPDQARAGPGADRCSSRFSATVRSGSSDSSWNAVATPSWRRAAGSTTRRTGCPKISTVAPVGADQSTEDLDQRALAGAVLAGERVDLSGTRRERRVPKSLDPAEGAVDTGRPYREDLGSGTGPGSSRADRQPSRESRMVMTVPRLTSSVLPGHGVPSVAASWQRMTVASGPESVKSAKKLSGRSGKTVSPGTSDSSTSRPGTGS